MRKFSIYHLRTGNYCFIWWGIYRPHISKITKCSKLIKVYKACNIIQIFKEEIIKDKNALHEYSLLFWPLIHWLMQFMFANSYQNKKLYNVVISSVCIFVVCVCVCVLYKFYVLCWRFQAYTEHKHIQSIIMQTSL